jgi:hypothetical protein
VTPAQSSNTLWQFGKVGNKHQKLAEVIKKLQDEMPDAPAA